MRAGLSGHHGKALETAQTRIQPGVVAAFQRTLQLSVMGKLGERFTLDDDLLPGQKLLGGFGFFRLKGAVHVEDTVADMLGQEIRAAGVGHNHRLFDHAVGNAALFGAHRQYITGGVEIKHVVRAVFKHQRVFIAPSGARLGQITQRSKLLGDLIRRCPVALTFDPVGDVVVNELGVRFNVRRKKAVIAQAAVSINIQRTGQRGALLAFPQRAEIIR